MGIIKYKILIFIYLFSSKLLILAQSNEGSEFWFSFLEHRDRGNSRMLMVTSKYPSNVRVYIPVTGWERKFSINAFELIGLNLPGECENIGSEYVQKAAVYVETDQPSTVYIHQFHQFRSDAATVLPVASLGRQYFAMCYEPYENSDDHYASEFVVIATEDQTQIQITPSAQTAGGALPGSIIQITLNKAETYQVQGRDQTADLTGSMITSNKPVAVFSGNRWTQVPNGCGNRDNLLEQMPPLETWGRAFIAQPSARVTEDRYRVLASEDQTLVTMNSKNSGSNTSFILNRGDWKELVLNQNPSLIISNKPICVAQFLVGGLCNGLNGLGDPSMLILNSNSQFKDTVIFFNSRFEYITEQFINIACRTQDSASIKIDGRFIHELGVYFQTIGQNLEFAFTTIEVSDGVHILTSSGCGLIASAYGYGQAESYAYGGGANYYKLNTLISDDGTCLGDSLFFNADIPESRFQLKWNLGDGTIRSDNKFFHQYKRLGIYRVSLILHDLCNQNSDTLYKDILISLRRPVVAGPDTTVCEGSIVQLRVSDRDSVTFNWYGPLGFQSNEQNPIVLLNSLEKSGIYTVTTDYFGCKTFPTSFPIKVVENPKPELGPDRFFCPQKENLEIELISTDKIQWSDGTEGSSIKIGAGGWYTVCLTNSWECKGIDSIFIEEKCPAIVYFPNIFSPNGDQINDLFKPIFEYVQNPQLKIYSRWGELLYYSDGQNPEWNGTSGNATVLPGVYVYVFQYEGYNELGIWKSFTMQGDITLLK